MNLSREQMLAEMGITPIWRLRESEAAVPADQAPDTLPPVEASAPAAVASASRAGSFSPRNHSGEK